MGDRSRLIMETIALVRSRKARPDLDRICKTMQRNHGVEPKETEKWLDLLCDQGIVARRPFKGAVSYRIVADEKTGPAKATALRYVRTARKITKAIAALDSHGLGVSFNAIERFITANWPLTCSILNLRVRLRSSLRDGVEDGRFIKTPNGCYKLGLSQSGVEEVSMKMYLVVFILSAFFKADGLFGRDAGVLFPFLQAFDIHFRFKFVRFFIY